MALDIVTVGCRLNIVESEAIRAKATAAGLGDIAIVNSCAVTAEAGRQARQAVRRLKRDDPARPVIVTGCAAQIEPARFATVPETALVLGNAEKLSDATWAALAPSNSLRGEAGPTDKLIVGDIIIQDALAHAPAPRAAAQTRAFLQVQNGCDHRCTFWAIRIGVWAASGALNSIRIAKGKAAETKTRKKATYRGRHILLKRPSNLPTKQAFALDGMLANDADLREAYEAKERFFQIWDAPDRGSAEMAIDEWMEAVPPQHRAAFKHAITAFEDWREEVLTYWGEFPEISNAYTEAANGMAKIHNRKGRGYKFEVIRARVLIDMRTVTPTDFVKCHGCGIGFAAGMLVAQEAVSIGRGRRKVHLTLCPNCMVRNQSGMMKLNHQPTFQSE